MKAKLATDNTLMFWCPGCEEHHGIQVDGSRGWTWNQSLESPTVSPSILVRSGHYVDGHSGDCWCNFKERFGNEPGFQCRRCHSFVKEGQIQFLDDCSHALKGQTVPLPDIETMRQ